MVHAERTTPRPDMVRMTMTIEPLQTIGEGMMGRQTERVLSGHSILLHCSHLVPFNT